MKKTLALSFLALVSGIICHGATIATNTTSVMFPLAQMFGGGAYNKPFRVDAVRPILTDGTNVYVGTFTQVTPTGGTNPVVKVTPNDYMVTFQDARIPWRISVPASTNVLNALSLTSTNSPLLTYIYVPPFPNNITAANVNLSGWFVGIATNNSDYPLTVTNPYYFNNRGRKFYAGSRTFGVSGTNGDYVLCDVDSGGYGHIALGGPAGVVYLGNSLGQIIAPGSIQGSDFVGANSYQSAYGGTNIDAFGNFFGGAANLMGGNASTFFGSGTIPAQFLPSSINGTNGLNGQNGTNVTVGFSGTMTNLASSVISGGNYSNVVVLQQGSPLDGVYANPGISVYGNASMTFASTGTNWARGTFSYGQQYYLVGQGIFFGFTNNWTNWCFFSFFKASAISLPNTTVYSTNVNLTATPPATGWSAYSGLTPNPTYFPSSAYVTTLTQHFNLTTFTNGVCLTNIFQ